MKIKINKSQISGTIAAPPSKSLTHRALIAAALANGSSVIKNVLLSDDTTYTIKALQAFGVSITLDGTTATVLGTHGKLSAPKEPIFVGDSGTTARFVIALASLANGTTTIDGSERLRKRPMRDLIDGLQQLGTSVTATDEGFLPIVVHGKSLEGKTITIDGSKSSQFLSSLLLISPFAKEPITLIVKRLKSKPYVQLTLVLMQQFGITVKNNNFQTVVIPTNQSYKGTNYTVEGDFSSASYFFAAAAITGSSLTVTGLTPDSVQADAQMLSLLEQMGCSAELSEATITLHGPKRLTAIAADMADCPDIVQTLAVVATVAEGETTIFNISHLKYKETDRIENTAKELQKMGIAVSSDLHALHITGGKPKAAIIETHNDHRMAMSFAIAGLAIDSGITITHAEVVKKSYPNFWKDLQSIGANTKTI